MKFKKTLMTAGALLATLFTVSTAAADSNVQKVIDETYVQPEGVLWPFVCSHVERCCQ